MEKLRFVSEDDSFKIAEFGLEVLGDEATVTINGLAVIRFYIDTTNNKVRASAISHLDPSIIYTTSPTGPIVIDS